MDWELAEQAKIEDGAYYLVQTNGAEWRDVDLMVMAAMCVRLRLKPHYVRGRPVWIAKITRPALALKEQQK